MLRSKALYCMARRGAAFRVYATLVVTFVEFDKRDHLETSLQ